jgi:glycosyltransferase involved in cell wall biosynthesis
MNTPSRNIWLISPYDTGSHHVWARGYMAHTRHHITLLRMAGRFWKWRMQGGAIELAEQAHTALAENGPPDAVLATDMLNLPAWLGLLHDDLPAHTPIVLYMHENQITYPWRAGEQRDLTYGMINWLSQLSATRVCFNSRYHLESWFDELPRLLKHYPDYNHLRLVDDVRARSCVLPVGIDCTTFAPGPGIPQSARDAEPPIILWNQRWEYDKRPDRFFALMERLRERDVPFRLAVAGENFRNVPQEFEAARARLGNRIVHWGYVESRDEYAALLRDAGVVISTADHEFFGISVLEAITAGAYPLLPDRLSYPELMSRDLHGRCLYGSEDDLLDKATQILVERRPAPSTLCDRVTTHYDWSVVAQRYDDLLSSVTA